MLKGLTFRSVRHCFLCFRLSSRPLSRPLSRLKPVESTHGWKPESASSILLCESMSQELSRLKPVMSQLIEKKDWFKC